MVRMNLPSSLQSATHPSLWDPVFEIDFDGHGLLEDDFVRVPVD
jgi:hypothetical protein